MSKLAKRSTTSVVGPDSSKPEKVEFIRQMMLTGEYWGGATTYKDRKAQRASMAERLGLTEAKLREHAAQAIQNLYSQKLTVEQHVRLVLHEIADHPDPGYRLQAVREINKMMGFYAPTKQEHKFEYDETKGWEDLRAWVNDPTPALEKMLNEAGWHRVVQTEGEDG